MNTNQHDKIIRNCSDKWSQQSATGPVQSWQKLGSGHITALLEGAANAARADARDLLQQLSRLPWRVDGDVQSGSPDGAESAADDSYIALLVAGRRYHLHCNELPVLHVVQITA